MIYFYCQVIYLKYLPTYFTKYFIIYKPHTENKIAITKNTFVIVNGSFSFAILFFTKLNGIFRDARTTHDEKMKTGLVINDNYIIKK